MFLNKDYILTIYREGSFSKAAQKLYISQPSLSATVKRIENKISFPLFNRTTTPISLTEIGHKYIKYALEIEEIERNFEKWISDNKKLLVGSIKIGGSSLFSSFILPPIISEFNKKYPQIKFELYENNTKALVQKLSDGSLDLILDNTNINNKNISSNIYTTELILLAVPKSFKINEKLKDFRLTSQDIKNRQTLLK